MKLVECVPNFSEGRRPEVIQSADLDIQSLHVLSGGFELVLHLTGLRTNILASEAKRVATLELVTETGDLHGLLILHGKQLLLCLLRRRHGLVFGDLHPNLARPGICAGPLGAVRQRSRHTAADISWATLRPERDQQKQDEPQRTNCRPSGHGMSTF